jgi:hypothetical protein
VGGPSINLRAAIRASVRLLVHTPLPTRPGLRRVPRALRDASSFGAAPFGASSFEASKLPPSECLRIFRGCFLRGCLVRGFLLRGCLFGGCLIQGCILRSCLFHGCLFQSIPRSRCIGCGSTVCPHFEDSCFRSGQWTTRTITGHNPKGTNSEIARHSPNHGYNDQGPYGNRIWFRPHGCCRGT